MADEVDLRLAQETKEQIRLLMQSKTEPLIQGRLAITEQQAFIQRQKENLLESENKLEEMKNAENQSIRSLLELAKLAGVSIDRGEKLQTLFALLSVRPDLTEEEAVAAQTLVHDISGVSWRM